ncbi:hypothetical protein FRC01_009517 [Tulasnella sp. 417]|nr:hypothetical protein FRC01_009517 [Tulasnella sp. 417]
MAAFENPPPGYAPDGQPERLREGLYILVNKKSRSTLDLAGGWHGPGTHVLGFEQHIEWDNSNQMWHIKQDGLNGTYTLRNLLSGTFLDLEAGNPRNGSQVVGWPRELRGESRANQEWHIEEKEPNYYMLQCSRTNTFLEIPGGNPSNCADVKCSELSYYNDHQLWSLDLASRTGAEIKELFMSWKPSLLPQIFQLYAESTQYPASLRPRSQLR